MRKVIFGINSTIDGCVDHSKGSGSEDVHRYFTRLMLQGGTLAYGRITYELMVPFWPELAKDEKGQGSMYEFARAFDAVPEIVVFSRTLKSSANRKTRIVSSDPCEEIRRLKADSGKPILLGGVDVASKIIAADLVDEYHIIIQPWLAGEGRRMMGGIFLDKSRSFNLIETRNLPSGDVVLKYERLRTEDE